MEGQHFGPGSPLGPSPPGPCHCGSGEGVAVFGAAVAAAPVAVAEAADSAAGPLLLRSASASSPRGGRQKSSW